jgi:LuxR family maltose regulon positive regulatory protein
MGQSLPLPTDIRPGARPGKERAGSGLLTMDVSPADTGTPDAVVDDPELSGHASAEPSLDVFSAAIVRGKVRIPSLRPDTLERPRLLNWLEEHAGQRVRVVTAEAGYGKTTLIADHVKRSGRRVAWIRLESADADWVAMLSYLVASCREVIPDFGVGAVNLLQRVGVLNATRDMVLDIILSDLERSVTDPLTLVLDDFHAVQDGDDVRAIVSRLIELAPPTVHFVISGRRPPGSLLTRPTSQGQVVVLGTQELRFTRTEAGHLLANILGNPLDEDLIAILDDRLAGWGASLQLVGTSLIGLRPASVRVFIEELTSRSEPLYDYLVEHVLARQPASMRRVLSVASILERIEPRLLLAALSGETHASPRRIAAALAQAEDAGIIGRSSTGGSWWRLHPLVRDFMLSRLLESTGRPALLGMHLRVAQAAEHVDWAVAAHHYIEAERHEDAMRVLRESAIEALGTASWGEATALADRMPDQPVPEVVSVIRAYDLASRGQTRLASLLLQGLQPHRADAMAWGLTKVALAHVHVLSGDREGLRHVMEELRAEPALPDVIASLSDGIRVLVVTHDGGPIADASDVLERIALDQARLGLTRYAAVSYHNAAVAAFARGNYGAAERLGKRAIEQFNRTRSTHDVDSTQSLVALSLWELGDTDRAAQYLDGASSAETKSADAQSDAAWIRAAAGETDAAWVLIERATRSSIESSANSAAAINRYTRALAHLVDGDSQAAGDALIGADESSVEPDARARHLAMASLVVLVAGNRPEAVRLARDCLAVADGQGAVHWIRWARLVAAVGESDPDGFRRSLLDISANAKLSTLALADAIVLGMGLIGTPPSDVLELMRARPGRWLPALRRALHGADQRAALAAADVLATLGTIEDVTLLATFERKHVRQPARRVLSRRLARHVNPTMVIHDLGRVRIQLGARVVPLSQSRRKAASLLAFLASRPSHSATRDQVLDAMWPNQSPDGAANSLHQTMYFLRRDIDPWFEDGNSVDYLVVEPDVVFLDPELVLVDSAAFFRQVTTALAGNGVADIAPPLLRDYQAKFALDFEYEEWSFAWRGQLHGLFLEATEAAADALLASERPEVAADVVQRALAVDPTAIDLQATLIRALSRCGATAAALHQYRHYAKAYEEDIGGQAPPLEALLGDHAGAKRRA